MGLTLFIVRNFQIILGRNRKFVKGFLKKKHNHVVVMLSFLVTLRMEG